MKKRQSRDPKEMSEIFEEFFKTQNIHVWKKLEDQLRYIKYLQKRLGIENLTPTKRQILITKHLNIQPDVQKEIDDFRELLIEALIAEIKLKEAEKTKAKR